MCYSCSIRGLIICLIIDLYKTSISVSSSLVNLVIEDTASSFSNTSVNSSNSSKIIPIIDEAFKHTSFKLRDIDKILVCNGPGSFTGIRVGVTVAKTIAWALKIDIIPISSLELLSTTKTNKKFLVPMIDARRGNVFGAIYDTSLKLIKKDSMIGIEELINNLDSNYEFVSYDSLNVKDVIKPSIDILKIVDKHKNDKGINPHNLNPNYLKLTEAEENLRGKND